MYIIVVENKIQENINDNIHEDDNDSIQEDDNDSIQGDNNGQEQLSTTSKTHLKNVYQVDDYVDKTLDIQQNNSDDNLESILMSLLSKKGSVIMI